MRNIVEPEMEEAFPADIWTVHASADDNIPKTIDVMKEKRLRDYKQYYEDLSNAETQEEKEKIK